MRIAGEQGRAGGAPEAGDRPFVRGRFRLREGRGKARQETQQGGGEARGGSEGSVHRRGFGRGRPQGEDAVSRQVAEERESREFGAPVARERETHRLAPEKGIE